MNIIFRQKSGLILILVLITIIIYSNSLKAPFIFDDIHKIVQNPDIKNIKNIFSKLIYPYNTNDYIYDRNDPSRPLIYLSFTLNYYFGGLNTLGYHLVNLVSHILNSILIFLFILKILYFVNDNYKYKIQVAFLVSLIFAIHPVNVSAVTYIYSRSDLFSTLFYISSILLFLNTVENKNNNLLFLSLICFIMALLSKQIAVTLPVIIFLTDYIILSNCEIKKVFEKRYYHIGYWLILFIYLILKYKYLGGIKDVEAGGSLWNRYSYIIIQPYVILKYLQLLILPIGLCIDHWIKPPTSIFELRILVSVVIILTVFLIGVIIYKKSNLKLYLFSGLWFLIVLAPTSSIFPTTSPVVENRLYLAEITFFLLIIISFFCLKSYYTKNRATRYLTVFLIIYLICLCISTIRRNQIFNDPVILWQDTIKKYPDNYLAYNRLGDSYLENGQISNAIQSYNKSIDIKPDNFVAHINLALLYDSMKEYEYAIKEYKKVIEINPEYVLAYIKLAMIYQIKKEYKKSDEFYQQALKIRPDLKLKLRW